MPTPYTHSPSAATLATQTAAALDSRTQVVVDWASWSYDGDPTGGVLSFESPSGTVIYKQDITKGGPGITNFGGCGLPGAVGQAVIGKLASGGGSVSGKLNFATRN